MPGDDARAQVTKKRAPARPGRNDSSGQDLKLRVEGGSGSRPASGEATGRDVRAATSLAGKRRHANPVRPGPECHLHADGCIGSSGPGRRPVLRSLFFLSARRHRDKSMLCGHPACAGDAGDASAARSRTVPCACGSRCGARCAKFRIRPAWTPRVVPGSTPRRRHRRRAATGEHRPSLRPTYRRPPTRRAGLRPGSAARSRHHR